MAKEEVLEVVEEPTNTEETEEELSPWYVFCSTGCGFCKKAEPVVEALNNEGYDILTLDISEPNNAKLNQELKTKYNTQCGTPWFINAETGKGVCGFREKDVLKAWLDGEEIPEPPKPTGPPPRPPFNNAPDKELDVWKTEYAEWLKKNEHLPENQLLNLLLDRLGLQKEQFQEFLLEFDFEFPLIFRSPVGDCAHL